MDIEIINNFILEGRERYLLGTLPDEYRPCNKTVIKMVTYDYNNFALQINENGDIYIINMTPNPQETTSLWGHAVFSLI